MMDEKVRKLEWAAEHIRDEAKRMQAQVSHPRDWHAEALKFAAFIVETEMRKLAETTPSVNGGQK